jgi:hypothetical protein
MVLISAYRGQHWKDKQNKIMLKKEGNSNGIKLVLLARLQKHLVFFNDIVLSVCHTKCYKIFVWNINLFSVLYYMYYYYITLYENLKIVLFQWQMYSGGSGANVIKLFP